MSYTFTVVRYDHINNVKTTTTFTDDDYDEAYDQAYASLVHEHDDLVNFGKNREDYLEVIDYGLDEQWPCYCTELDGGSCYGVLTRHRHEEPDYEWFMQGGETRTPKRVQVLVDGMTDEEFVNLIHYANERISEFDRADLSTELCKAAMAIVAATIEGPASGAYGELGDCIDEFDAVLGRE